MKKTFSNIVVLAAAAVAMGSVVSASHAALRITEAMSSSGGNGTNDWFEVTNNGPTAETFTGYRMDDATSFANSVLLTGVTSIAPGESVVFIEQTNNDPDVSVLISNFRTFWGLAGYQQVGSYNGVGAGVSFSSGGDGTTLFTSGGTQVSAVTFGAATAGASFEWDKLTGASLGLSVNGENLAYNAPGVSDTQNVGSPAAVPEPASIGLIGAAGLMAMRRRRTK